MIEALTADFSDRRIGDYLAALSSGTPTPGGGSAAGLAGALGCALGAMVCNLTLAKRESDELSALVTRFSDLSGTLIELARRDEQAFARYRSAMALPRSSDEEKTARRAEIEQALVGAAETPLAAIEAGIAALDSLRQVAAIGTSHALGDLMTGGYLVRATILGSLENLWANIAAMKQPENRDRFESAARSADVQSNSAFAALQGTVSERQI